MSIAQIIYKKRKEYNLTQEQIADYLGVSAPAVSKWESGASCPDISLIAPLARLLKTDPNTLLCFKEELTELEITAFLVELSDCATEKGFADAFSLAQDKIREYPNCMPLLEYVSVTLEGLLMMSETGKTERDAYTRQLTALYEQTASGNDPKMRERAIHMLVPKYIAQNDFEKAQEFIDRLPAPSELDRRQLQALLYFAKEKYADAGLIYEGKVLSCANMLLGSLLQLIDIAWKENRREDASAMAALHTEISRLLGFWEYNFYTAPLILALSKRDTGECLSLIKALFDTCDTPWDMTKYPIFYHITANAAPEKQAAQQNYGKQILPGLIASFEQNPEYDFLRDNKDFQELLTQYKVTSEIR